MDSMIEDLTSSLRQLDASALRRSAAGIRAHSDELGWVRATVSIDRALRRQRRSVQAGGAARMAADAVGVAATACGLAADDPDVSCVSRRAGEVARGLLVAGTVLPHLAWLLAGWRESVSFRLPGPQAVSASQWWLGGSWQQSTGA